MPVPRISKDDLKQRLEAESETKPVLVDARLKYPYEHSSLTLPGAIRLSGSPPDLSMLPRDREIVVYDSDPDEVAGASLADTLIRNGYRAVVLQGGIGDWITAKLPTDAKSPAQGTAAPAPKG